MKKIMLSKIFGFLLNRLQPSGKIKAPEGDKKLSPKHAHLLKVVRLLKNGRRQTARIKV